MKSKRFLSIAMSLLLCLGMFTTVNAVPGAKLQDLNKPVSNKTPIGKSIGAAAKAKNLKSTDEARIIVELMDKSIVEYATERGIKVKDLDKATTKKMKNELSNKQEDVKKAIKANGIKIKDLNSFVNIANGFSITTSIEEAMKIESIQGVKSVSIANEYERPVPQMNSSTGMVNAIRTWNELGYKGQGMVVAIIDTGIDSSHKDMILSSGTVPALDNAKIDSIISENSLQGTYRTLKVPYGYNYMDQNQQILDLGPDASRHGMHVAGIVGANGDLNNGGIKGVAPEVQLLAMKVFGNNPAMPSTFGDIIIKAIDDSIALGADVMNLSLGSSSNFVMPDDPEQLAVKRAVDNGVVMSISAGNSNLFGSGWDNPYVENPDYGVVGSPGLASESIQVASIENTNMTSNALEYSFNGETLKAGYMASGSLDPTIVFKDQKVQYVNCGLGGPTDFTAEVNGKIALIERGTYNFVDKIMNAQNNGALGVVVYNNAAGGENLVSMAYPPDGGKIPALFIQRSHGLKLLGLITTGTNYIEFKGATTVVPNPSSGKMAASTSWGTTPNLDFKPEITAPGGNIWSTDNNNGYQNMSGTSMAAPHVSGGAALVLQRVEKDFPNLKGAEKVAMVKNLLMSTAKPVGDFGTYNAGYGLTKYNFTSPRRQGAGVMDLFAATTTTAIVMEKSSGLSKVNLKQIGDTSQFTLSVYNFGQNPITYNVKGTVQTDLTLDDGYNRLETQGVYIDGTVSGTRPWMGKFPISFDNTTINVPAGGKVDLNVTLNLSNSVDWASNKSLKSLFPNGTFIEGFVTLEDVSDNNSDLSIPYTGFYGQWDKAPIIDVSNYNKNATSFYELTTMAWLDKAARMYNFLGYDAMGNPNENNIAFSPNNDGIADTAVPLLSFLRNAKELDINILDKNGNKLRDLANEEYIVKNYNPTTKYTSHDIWTWDGTINNKIAADGQYIYEIKAKVDYPGAEWQTYKFPVKIDTAKPVIEKIDYNKDKNTLTVKANDGSYPVYDYTLVENGKVLAQSTDGIFNLSGIAYDHKADLIVNDFAGNNMVQKLESVLKGKAQETVTPTPTPTPQPTQPPVTNEFVEPTGPAAGDVTIPTVMVTAPEFFGVYNTSQIAFKGYVNDKSSIQSFQIDGKDVPLLFNKSTGNWDFNTTLTLEDGYKPINLEAMDSANNKIAFVHKIFIDTTAPVITMVEEPVSSTKEANVTLKVLVTDNMPSLKVKVNENMITNIAPDWSYFNDLPAAKYNMEYEVKLADGVNKITIEASDNAGNVTIKSFNINKIKKNK